LLLAICALAFAAMQSMAAASAQEAGLAQLGVERWTSEAGLGGNWVRDIVEGPDGMLWIATPNGLSRFDGRSFSNFSAIDSPGLPHSAISALANGTDGRIWIGLEYGGVRELVNGAILRDTARAQLPGGSVVTDLVEDRAGTLWVATLKGLWKFADGRSEPVAPNATASEAAIRTLVLSSTGDIWARSANHGLWRITAGDATAVQDAPGCVGYGLALDAAGSMVTTCTNGVWRWDAGSAQWSQLAPDASVGPVMIDRRGGIWFGAQAGLTRWANGTIETRPADDQLRDWRIRAFFEDSRGEVWVGTFAGGLTRLRRGPVRAFGAAEQLPIQGTTAVLASPTGDLWIGALGQGLLQWRPESGIQRHWSVDNGLPGPTAWALAIDPRRPQGLWVGTDRGLAWLEAGRMQASGPAGIAYDGPVRLIYVDPLRADTLWISGEGGGVLELSAGQRIVHDRDRGLGLDQVMFFHRDRRGRLLAGGHAGLFVLDRGEWAEMSLAQGPIPAPRAITEQADGVLWIASDIDGLVRVAPDGVRSYGFKDGLPFWPVYSLELDRSGGLWLSGNDGLVRIRLDDHERWRRGELASIPFERLTRRDGLRDAECNGWGKPSSTRLADGTLVYPTIAGVALVDATSLPEVALTSDEIYVEYAWTGTRAFKLSEPLRLADVERSLRIGFSAIELVRPEAVSFRYRLEGIDRDWSAASGVSEATYAHLPPGAFRFRLQARLPGRAWIESTDTLDVVVEPLLWESASFRAAIAVLIMAIVLAVFRWRLQVEGRHARVLGRARAFLRQVIDISPNPIFARQRGGAYTLANRAAADIYGLSPDQVEGQAPQLGKELPGMAEVDAVDADVIASGEERVLPESEIVDHTGRKRWFRVVKRPGFGADGRSVEQVIGTAVDVTDFKLAELRLMREERKLRRSREEARRLSRQLLRAQEEERRRLAREMHDDLTQRLAGLAMLSWSTYQTLERDRGSDVRRNIEEIASELERIANEVQAMSRELHPPALASLGLADALQAECATFAKRTGIAVEFASSAVLVDPEPEIGLALYRIVQEGLRNSLAHSGTGQVRVSVSGDEREIRLEISDSGAGFDPATILAKPGLGLSSIRERARLAGGEVDIDSAPGQGARISVRVPILTPEGKG
jgi:PAS domain S-box-containing protein